MKKISLLSIIIIMFGTFAAMAQAPALPPQIPGADIKFYVADNGIPTGPFNLFTLQSMVRNRKVTQATLVWRDGMSGWTQAGLVAELFGIFSSQLLAQSGSVSGGYAQTGYTQTSSQQSGMQQVSDFDPNNPQSVNGQKPLTDKEQKFVTEKLYGKWHVNPTDKAAMKRTFNRNLAMGISLAVVGTVLQSTGAGVIGGVVWMGFTGLIVGSAVGGTFLLAGLIIGPMCAIGFINAGRTGNVYKKTTGQKLFSFLERTNFNGGYDWDNHEVTVAMAIKL